MFFVNDDLKKSTNQYSLGQVIKDENVKVAYGVLSLSSFYKMIRHMPGHEKIFIPKVQRGLVWEIEDKNKFITNCIKGDEGGLREPMPNIFLFYDETTKDIQLFDGLQRTASILKEFKTIDEIKDKYDIMIPAALFKGSRPDAEDLFRHINDRGVKLNDFEKLASYGGRYEINFEELSKEFQENFNDFIDVTTKQYIKAGMSVSIKEKTTIYEILTYVIYNFSKHDNARKIFPKKIKEKEHFVWEWGFQVAYSTTTTTKRKEYSKKYMKNNLLKDFSNIIRYDNETKIFDEEALEVYIEKMIKAITKTSNSLKDLYEKNLTANNKEYVSRAAIKSNSLVGAVVSCWFLYEDKLSNSFIRKWYLLQLIKGRADKNTNKIIDELTADISTKDTEIDRRIKMEIKQQIEEDAYRKTYSSWLWTLFYIYYEYLIESDLSTKFEIDHIIPKSKLNKFGLKSKENNIGNLVIIKKIINKRKSSTMLNKFVIENEEYHSEIAKYITIGKNDEFESILDKDKLIEKWMFKDNKEMVEVEYNAFVKNRINLIKEKLDI